MDRHEIDGICDYYISLNFSAKITSHIVAPNGETKGGMQGDKPMYGLATGGKIERR